jgi:hypothetical protein
LLIVSRSLKSFPAIRLVFWLGGILLAAFEAWAFRYRTTADSISYLDMSDGVMRGGDWRRLINGVWSPLYPLLLGLFRRAFGISPANEIVAAHLLNALFFVAAFFCFEFFLSRLRRLMHASREGSSPSSSAMMPEWAFVVVAYSLFVWGAVFMISLDRMRPDMLMSCFLYLAVGVLLGMTGRPARWSKYIALGAVLGLGYLAKVPILPIAVMILGISLFVVDNWRPAAKMAVAAFSIVLAIGSLYFVPLSRAHGKLTFGESGAYNYLVNVDRAGPGFGWYLENAGAGSGSPAHPPAQIFSSPRAYAFGYGSLVTHPLRFDPSEWMQGLRPRIAVKRQAGEAYVNFLYLCRYFVPLSGVIAGILLIAALGPRTRVRDRFRHAWPVLFIGIAGCAMYIPVHLEGRYVGAFLVLFFCALLGCFPDLPRKATPRMTAVALALILAMLLLRPAAKLYSESADLRHQGNEDALAADELHRLGVEAGDHVGRVSSRLNDLAVERLSRTEVVAEIDFTQAKHFWTAPVETQHQALQALASRGAKVVIATQPQLKDDNRPDWKRLAGTQYWAWFPSGPAGVQ